MLNKIRLRIPRFFLSKEETQELMKRVAAFESATGCELIFHFRKNLGSDPLEANRRLFSKFKLHETRGRTGILITLALKDRRFAVWADEGVVRRAHDKLWDQVSEAMALELKKGRRLQALQVAMEIAGPPLQREQPYILENQDDEISNSPLLDDEESEGGES